MIYIKKLDDFFDSISEAFDNPLSIKWIDKDMILRGLFTINNNVYQIVCENKGNNIWKYDSYHYNENNIFSPEITNINIDKFRVLPTIKVGIQYLYDNKDVDVIIFGASDKSKGRKKLYESFCEDFSKRNDLNYYTKVYSNLDQNVDRQIFVLFKSEVDRDILSDKIIQIIEEEKFGI